FSISWSASRKGRFRRAARRRPIQDLPAPISPTRTICRGTGISWDKFSSCVILLRACCKGRSLLGAWLHNEQALPIFLPLVPLFRHCRILSPSLGPGARLVAAS